MHTPILRYHGGKFRLSKWIISFFPGHNTYVEPFAGAASVLLQKARSNGEVYNDLDRDIFNLFKVLRDKEKSKLLFDLVNLTPYARDEFLLAYEDCDDPVEKARRVIVRASMEFGSGAASGHKTGFRCDAKRTSPTPAKVWAKYPPVIKFVTERLKGVNIENRTAIDCIKNHDSENTLFYVDPPYLLETRNSACSGKVYKHEMSDLEHKRLIDVLKSVRGMVVLSGYNSDLYNDLLVGWRKEVKNAAMSSKNGTKSKTECLWINDNCSKKLISNKQSIHHASRSSYVTHHMRVQSTEAQLKKAIEKLSVNREKVTKVAVAKLVGISREQVSRKYSHLFEDI